MSENTEVTTTSQEITNDTINLSEMSNYTKEVVEITHKDVETTKEDEELHKMHINDIRSDSRFKVVEVEKPEDIDKLTSDELHLHNREGKLVEIIKGKDRIKSFLAMRQMVNEVPEKFSKAKELRQMRKQMKRARKQMQVGDVFDLTPELNNIEDKK